MISTQVSSVVVGMGTLALGPERTSATPSATPPPNVYRPSTSTPCCCFRHTQENDSHECKSLSSCTVAMPLWLTSSWIRIRPPNTWKPRPFSSQCSLGSYSRSIELEERKVGQQFKKRFGEFPFDHMDALAVRQARARALTSMKAKGDEEAEKKKKKKKHKKAKEEDKEDKEYGEEKKEEEEEARRREGGGGQRLGGQRAQRRRVGGRRRQL